MTVKEKSVYYEKVIELDNLKASLQGLKKNSRPSGVDGISKKNPISRERLSQASQRPKDS
jgi:hypothetical protein